MVCQTYRLTHLYRFLMQHIHLNIEFLFLKKYTVNISIWQIFQALHAMVYNIN